MGAVRTHSFRAARLADKVVNDTHSCVASRNYCLSLSIRHCCVTFRLHCSDARRVCLPHRNSEIYNHEEVKAQHLPGVRIVKDSKSDSAIIGHLYQVRWHSLSSSSQTRLHELHSRAGSLLLCAWASKWRAVAHALCMWSWLCLYATACKLRYERDPCAACA